MIRVAVTILIGLFVVLGCGNDTIVKPEPKINTPPVIDALILPQRVEPGAKVNLQVITRDAEDDKLNVNWQVAEGSLDTVNKVWTAPNHATTVEITVFVTDRTNKAVSAKKNVQVVSTQPVVPPPSPNNQPIQHPEPPTPANPTVPEPVGKEEAKIFPGMEIVVITPGLEDVSVRLRQDIDELEQLYGRPEVHATGVLIFNAPRLGEFGILPNNNDEVGQILTIDKRYKTARGIGVGSTRAAVLKAYGEPDEADEALRVDHYDFEGISFAYDKDWQVEAIFIF